MKSAAAENYFESDCLAVIRLRRPQDRDDSAVAWLPVFLRGADGLACVRIDGTWIEVESMPGFQRYEKLRRKRLYDTATGTLPECQ